MNIIGPTLPGLAARLCLAGPTALSLPLLARGWGYGVGTLSMGLLLDRWKYVACI